MPSLSPKDRVSLCMFTFSDGRRCRTPRTTGHPHFCFCHAQKEVQARAAETLGKDLAYFFSGEYLSACDLSSALGRLIPAVVRGEVKPRTARIVAYLAQTLMQAIHISQDEYINAYDTNGWRKSIRNSVSGNYDYLFPPAPAATGADSPAPAPPESPQPQHPASPPADAPLNCNSEPSEEPAPSADHSPLVTPHSPLPQAEGSNPIPATPFAQPAPAAHSDNPPPARPSTPQPAPNRDLYALHFDHNCRLRIDGKLV